MNVPPDDDRLYSDYRHLHIHGRVLRPHKIDVETAEVLFIPKVGLSERELQHGQTRPSAVGSVSTDGMRAKGMRLTGYLSMSGDALGLVPQMLTGERYKYVLLYGERLRYRKALIRHYFFSGKYNDEEYPDE